MFAGGRQSVKKPEGNFCSFTKPLISILEAFLNMWRLHSLTSQFNEISSFVFTVLINNISKFLGTHRTVEEDN